MARGRPLLVGALLGGSLSIGGIVIALGVTELPPSVGVALVLVGALALAVGVRAQRTAPPEPSLNEDETEIARYQPTQKPALLLMGAGTIWLAVAAGLLVGTRLPYIYPVSAAAVGLYFTMSGGARYYKNSLTTYYLTDRRVISEYRFYRLNRAKVNLGDAEGGERSDSRLERLVGAGSITIRAPSLSVSFRNVPSPDDVDEQIETLIHEQRQRAAA